MTENQNSDSTTITGDTGWHQLSVRDTRHRLDLPDTGAETGLSSEDASQRLETYGRNELAGTEHDSRLVTLLKQFQSPMVYFLLVAAVLTLFMQEWFDALVIVLVLILNASIGYWQARKSLRDVQALQDLSSPEARVVRDGAQVIVPAEDLVPGDLVVLESGDKIPADLRFVATRGLRVDESMLTGESVAVTKDHDATLEADAALGDRTNLGYSGTLVVSGRARGLVVGTGENTELGTIASLVAGETNVSPLQELTGRLERFIAWAIIAAAAVIFLVSLITGSSVSETIRVTVALVVSAMPEALPIVLSVAMGVGVSRMAQRNAIVRELPAVETLGSTTVIGSDKTGTLTRNEMTVEYLWTPRGGYIDLTADGDIDPHADGGVALTDEQRRSLMTGALTNDAVQDSDGTVRTGDAVDVAMARVGLELGAVSPEDRDRNNRVAAMPYESELAFSQTVVQRTEDEPAVLHVKGAPETIREFCATDVDDLDEVLDELAERGLRVIATAHRVLTDEEAARYAELTSTGDSLPMPENLELTGLEAMMDPPREGVREAIDACRKAGIHVMMITGDHPKTAAAIGRRLGLIRSHDAGDFVVMTGADMATMSDPELLEALHTVKVAARMSPQDKLRVVKLLKDKDNQIVAVTGDGVNDAPALKAASIGVAMGESGTDVARESADVVLTDDNFVTIVDAVEQGRVTFSTIRKATFFLLSNGLASLIAVTVNTFTELPLIFLPAMLLIMNVVTNGIQDVALGFEKGEGDELDQQPRARDEGVLNTTMWLRTVITGVWMGVGALTVYRVAHGMGLDLDHARTLALITMVMFNFFQVFSARAERKSVFQISPFSNPFLLISAIAALVVQWGLTAWPAAAELIGLSPLSVTEWLICAAIGSTVLIIVEIEKLSRRIAASRREKNETA